MADAADRSSVPGAAPQRRATALHRTAWPCAASSARAAAHAMNMRAAEAIVSSAPKPMKIFPISEV